MIKDVEFAKEIIENSQQDFSKKVNINSFLKDNQAEEIIGIYTEKIEISVRSPKAIFNILVAQPLKNIYRNKEKSVVILVDGLDESPLGLDSITSLIANNDTLPPNVRFIITTRDYEEIIGKFSRDSKIISLSEEYYDKNNEDISKYVKSRIKNNFNLLQTYKEFDKDVIDKSGGIFLYVKFLFDAIDGGKLQPTKEDLDKVPPLLDGLYKEFLARIKDEDKDRWENSLKPILSVLSIAFESLTQNQLLSILVEMDDSQLSDSLSDLRPFIQEETDGKISDGIKYKIYHQSLVDFFRNKEVTIVKKDGEEIKQKNEGYYIPEQQAHKKIVSRYYDKDYDLLIDSVDGYSARYLSDHICSIMDYQDPFRTDWYTILLNLAKNQAFQDKQRKYFPLVESFHLKTIKNAFQAALSKEDPLSMCDMLLLHAKQISKITKESPLDVLNSITKNNEFDLLQKAWNIADLYDPERELLWYLLMIWDLKNRENILAARKTLDHLLQKKTPNIDKKYYRMFIFLVSSLQSDFENSLEKLYSCITDDNHQLSFLTENKYLNDINIITFLKNSSILNKIKDPQLLLYLATKQAQANDFASALETASKIQNNFRKLDALFAIASAQAKNGLRQEAASTFALALEITKIMTNDDEDEEKSFMPIRVVIKLQAPIVIVSAQAETKDFASALETASKIKDDDLKSEALIAIASAQAKNGLRQEATSTFASALETTSRIKSDYLQLNFLIAIASAQAKNGLTKEATSTLSSAFKSALLNKRDYDYRNSNTFIASDLDTASNIKDDSYKYQTLSSIASSQTQTNYFDSSISRIERTDDSYKYKALSDISLAQAQTKDFASALETVSKIKDDYRKSEALIAIASAQAKNGLRQEATSTFASAIETASKIPNYDRKYDALIAIASVQAVNGLTKEATSTFASARETVSEIIDDYRKYEAIIAIASAQAKNGLRQEATSTLSSAFKSAIQNKRDIYKENAVYTRIPDNYYRKLDALINLASAQAEDGLRQEATSTFASALDAASMIGDKYPKLDFLIAIASAQAKNGLRQEATSTFASALETASKINDDYNIYHSALETSSRIKDDYRKYDSALETKSTINDGYHKYVALIAIASAQEKMVLDKRLLLHLPQLLKQHQRYPIMTANMMLLLP